MSPLKVRLSICSHQNLHGVQERTSTIRRSTHDMELVERGDSFKVAGEGREERRLRCEEGRLRRKISFHILHIHAVHEHPLTRGGVAEVSLAVLHNVCFRGAHAVGHGEDGDEEGRGREGDP